MTEKIKKITSVLVLLSLLSFYFAAPFTVKKADAILGVADQSFDVTIGDIPRLIFDIVTKIAKFGLEKLKKRMLTQIQNDLVNWVQNGGEPRFVKDPGKFIKDNADATAAKEIDKLFLSKNINICSPFRANVRFLVSKPLLLKEESVRCSLGDMVDNLKNFAQNFEDGGWTAWLKLHETRNTLPGSYLAASELIGAKVTRSGNAAQANISAGKGFLDQKACSKSQTPNYIVSFVTSGDGVLHDVPVAKELVSRLTVEVLSWATVWDELNTGISFFNVDPFTIDLENTGESTTQTHTPPIIKLPPGDVCVQEETITPGSIIGDQISGVLEKTGIDKIINANDIVQILDAVIDAAVNRAAREGLSYMKSGRGSWTVPADRRASAGANTQQVIGLESSEAISIQNQLIDLRTAAQRLKLDISKLTKEDNLDNFNQKLSDIAGDLQEDGTLSDGDVDKNLRAKDNDNKLSDVIDRLFKKYNKEGDNPGVYAANRALNQKIADVWQAITGVFSSLSESAPYGDNQSCIDIDYTLKPEIEDGKDRTPFIDSDGNAFHWSSHTESYVARIKDKSGSGEGDFNSPKAPVTVIMQFASNRAANAESKSFEYRLAAEAYQSSSENSQGTINELEADVEFVQNNLPQMILYTSILMDYDRIGRNHNLITGIKKYQETLQDRNALAEGLEEAYLALRGAEAATRQDWLAEQRTLAAGGDARATGKAAVIEESNLIIDLALRDIDESRIPDNLTGLPIIDPTQLGTRAGQAVATAMGMNIEGLRSEMEERQSRIGRQQTDISNRLGAFPEKAALRKETGLEGGNSEWEKYFENRFQLVYAAFIYDFYKNHFVNEMCSNDPVGSE